MQEKTTPMCEATEQVFFAVCRDCGNLKDASFDHKRCECGGVYHVDSARCLKCGRRYPFSCVGKKCATGDGGDIVAKMVSCPSCHANMTIKHLGENCPVCNVQLRMEG